MGSESKACPDTVFRGWECKTAKSSSWPLPVSGFYYCRCTWLLLLLLRLGWLMKGEGRKGWRRHQEQKGFPFPQAFQATRRDKAQPVQRVWCDRRAAPKTMGRVQDSKYKWFQNAVAMNPVHEMHFNMNWFEVHMLNWSLTCIKKSLRKRQWFKVQDMKEICLLFLCETEQVFHSFQRFLKAFYSFRKGMSA